VPFEIAIVTTDASTSLSEIRKLSVVLSFRTESESKRVRLGVDNRDGNSNMNCIAPGCMNWHTKYQSPQGSTTFEEECPEEKGRSSSS
jgi:hypothetical protein